MDLIKFRILASILLGVGHISFTVLYPSYIANIAYLIKMVGASLLIFYFVRFKVWDVVLLNMLFFISDLIMLSKLFGL